MQLEGRILSCFCLAFSHFSRERRHRLAGSLIIVALLQLPCFLSVAQFAKLLDFGSQGKHPNGSLISDGTYYYGMTYDGGANDLGVVFKVKADGSGFSKLLDFDGSDNGSYPFGSLISDGTFLYGVTSTGGDIDAGTIFKIKPDGTGYVNLHSFDGINSKQPKGSLLLLNGTLYGTTVTGGGIDNIGTLFKISTDGTGFSVLYTFVYTPIFDSSPRAVEGANPQGSLIYDGTYLYGTASGGGNYDRGTVFAMKPDGSSFFVIHDFNNVEGSSPNGSLVSDGTFFYGTTMYGGSNDMGTLFKVKPDGTSFSTLVSFNGYSNGSNPSGSLYWDGGTSLYGATPSGNSNDSSNDFGTLFKIKTDGTGYFNLMDFNSTDGANSAGDLFFDGTYLAGMSVNGGASDFGTIFKIKPDGTGFVTVVSFDDIGKGPTGSLISDGTYLYGMTNNGGALDGGTIFRLLPDGSGYSKLFNFPSFEPVNGAFPSGSLYYDGTFLYGMTSAGGQHDSGTIFKIKPDGTNHTVLLSFDGTSGATPYGSLISDGTFLYGMASSGGNGDAGVVFKIMPDGTNYTLLADFTASGAGSSPGGDLIFDGTYLYGMTSNGGTNSAGTIFKVKPDGTAFATIVNFDGTTNDDPQGSLISDGTFLYGMTSGQGVSDGSGTIFKVKPDGTGFLQLLDFKTVTDANAPYGSLTFDGTSLYGMTSNDGISAGSIFKILPDGTGYAKLVDFNGLGSTPFGSLLLIGKVFYGMTAYGGTDDRGIAFLYDLSGSHTGPVIATDTQSTSVEGKVVFDILQLITTSGTLNVSSIKIITPPASGALATISSGVLTIDYKGISFSGTETIVIEACNTNGVCTQQTLHIEVAGDIVVYNALSPHGANPTFVIQYIDVLPETKNNVVTIFDRWENQIWSGANYDNSQVVFKGTSNSGSDLPNGIYFYKIEFASGKKTKTGFISLKR